MSPRKTCIPRPWAGRTLALLEGRAFLAPWNRSPLSGSVFIVPRLIASIRDRLHVSVPPSVCSANTNRCPAFARGAASRRLWPPFLRSPGKVAYAVLGGISSFTSVVKSRCAGGRCRENLLHRCPTPSQKQLFLCVSSQVVLARGACTCACVCRALSTPWGRRSEALCLVTQRPMVLFGTPAALSGPSRNLPLGFHCSTCQGSRTTLDGLLGHRCARSASSSGSWHHAGLPCLRNSVDPSTTLGSKDPFSE